MFANERKVLVIVVQPNNANKRVLIRNAGNGVGVVLRQ